MLDVLIVDDSAAIRKILQRVFRQTDLPIGHIVEAGDGKEALAALRTNRRLDPFGYQYAEYGWS